MMIMAFFLFFSPVARAGVTVDAVVSGVPVHPTELELALPDEDLSAPSPGIAAGGGIELGITRNYRGFVVLGLGGDHLSGTWTDAAGDLEVPGRIDKARALVLWRYALGPMKLLAPQEPPIASGSSGAAASAEPAERLRVFTPFVELGAGAELSWFHLDFWVGGVAPFWAPMLEAGAGATLGKGRVRGFGALRGRVDGTSRGALVMPECAEAETRCLGVDFAPGGPAVALELGVLAL
jgi:hypothetical protein